MTIDVAFIISDLKDEGSACLTSSASGFPMSLYRIQWNV